MKTEIIVVADESGSMQSVMDDANGAFSNFLAEQRDVPGEARVTLVKFANHTHMVYQGQDIRTAQALNLKPRGNTALYDALGLTITTQQDRIKKEGWADLVIFVVSTDGQENASVEYTLDAIKALTQLAEGAGWKFIYLMSNQDAFTQSRAMGSVMGRSMSKAATGQGEHDSYSYASIETRNLRTEGKQ
jgi:Mg-chelatase subunit ChlD